MPCEAMAHSPSWWRRKTNTLIPRDSKAGINTAGTNHHVRAAQLGSQFCTCIYHSHHPFYVRLIWWDRTGRSFWAPSISPAASSHGFFRRYFKASPKLWCGTTVGVLTADKDLLQELLTTDKDVILVRLLYHLLPRSGNMSSVPQKGSLILSWVLLHAVLRHTILKEAESLC